MFNMDLHKKSLIDLVEHIEGGHISSEEVTSYFLNRTKNDDVNAFVSLFDGAIDSAKEVDTRRAKQAPVGGLGGIPLGIKDNILVKGELCSAGSKMLEHYTAAYDATVTERLKRADATLVGRTNMDEFAFGSTTENSYFSTTKNPWDHTKVPGGTSGGSAAAVAAGMVPGAIGTDTGGSIRLPAALCGITGIKPTYGRVSRYGVIADASSFDQVGTLARSIQDAAFLLQFIEGKDPKDATSRSINETSIAQLLGLDSVKGIRIGLPKEYFIDGMDGEVKNAVQAAAKVLEEAGASIFEVSLPHTKYALASYYIIQPAEASSNLARYDGLRYGKRVDGKTLEDVYLKTRADGFGDESKRRIFIGTFALSSGYYDAYYKKAVAVRQLIRSDFENTFKDVDVLLTPTSPSPAWGIGEKFNDPIAMYLGDIYTISISLAGLPAISLPCGFTKSNLPIGMQLIGNSFDEHTLLKTGAVYQNATDWHTRMPEAYA